MAAEQAKEPEFVETLTAGVADEVRNPLNSLQINFNAAARVFSPGVVGGNPK